MSSEGMNRVWSFQRSLVNATVTARDGLMLFLTEQDMMEKVDLNLLKRVIYLNSATVQKFQQSDC